MELTAPGLEKIEGSRNHRAGEMDKPPRRDGRAHRAQRANLIADALFFQEDGKGPRKSIRKILIHIRTIRTLGWNRRRAFERL